MISIIINRVPHAVLLTFEYIPTHQGTASCPSPPRLLVGYAPYIIVAIVVLIIIAAIHVLIRKK
ncbi:MAG: hypothetical protein QW748_02550 [Candidatus Methanomethylicaceae archaeon]